MIDQRSAVRTPAADTVVAVVATLGIAAACWVVSVHRMAGMDMGVATERGSFGPFVLLWVAMMAAMMLPGAVPALTTLRPRSAPAFVATYLGVWTLVGLVVYAAYRPHGTLLAGVVVIAAGLYELTPVKRRFRRACRDRADSGFVFGLCCLGSSICLMALFVVVGLMSVTWMAVVAAVTFVQKVLQPRAALDVSVAIAIVVVGALILKGTIQ